MNSLLDAQTEGEVLRRAVQLLQERLPAGWTIEPRYEVGPINRDGKAS